MAGAPVKLGLVGAGRWGKNYIRTVASLSDCALVAVASSNPETSRLVPPGCRVVAAWKDIVAADDVDGVIVASPPDTHAEILEAAVYAGKAVLVEKPLVRSIADIPRIEAAVQRATGPVMVEHTLLFHPGFRALEREARSREPIRGVRSSAGAHGPYRRDTPVLWDWGPHDVAMCLQLLGPDCAVQGARCLEALPIEGVMAERLHLRLLFAGQIPAEIQLSTLEDKHRWFAVDFDRETLMFQDGGGDHLKLCPHSGALPGDIGAPIPVPLGQPLTQAVVEFVDAIRRGDPMRDSLQTGIAVVGVLARCETMLRR
jgi:predicted dehydrogenase